MTRSPDRDDRAVIVRLAEQEVSIRRIAKITKWSRPTIKKVLDSAGFDPSTKRIATGSPTGGVADSAPTVDYEASMKQADADARALWERWLLGEDLPTYGLPRGVGQVDQ
jgi:hypothetical protein